MTKNSITNQVAKEQGTTPAKAKPLVAAIFEILKETLENGKEVEISGFHPPQVRPCREQPDECDTKSL